MLGFSQPISDDIIAVASLEEYVTMLAGGLAGATPHMISATVTALSRVVFEFRGIVLAATSTRISGI
jgi:ribosomal RNA-processing protein 12